MYFTDEEYGKLYETWETKRSAGIELLLIFVVLPLIAVALTVFITLRVTRTHLKEFKGYDESTNTLKLDISWEGYCDTYVITPDKRIVLLKRSDCESATNLSVDEILSAGLYSNGKYEIYVKRLGKNIGSVREFWY